MTRTTLLALGVLPLVAGSPAHSAEHTVAPTVTTFDGAELGRPPSGFTTALTGGGGPVSWLVQEDPTAPSGSKVLVQTSADTTGSRFPLCVYDGVSTADGTFSVVFKPLSGTVDQAAGLVWRYQNPANYYLVRANALEGNVVLYKVENGRRSDLKPVGSGFLAYGRKAAVVRDRWQTLKVEVRGSRFSVFLGGEHLFDVEDSTFGAPGKVGLWTKADSVTAFDDLTIAPAISP
jgi:hypothetical protein